MEEHDDIMLRSSVEMPTRNNNNGGSLTNFVSSLSNLKISNYGQLQKNNDYGQLDQENDHP
jgi:hypothetical protein